MRKKKWDSKNIMVSCYKKLAAYESEIRFDPGIPNLGDLAIPKMQSIYAIIKRVSEKTCFLALLIFELLRSI
jgi:hypothetical protein